MTARFKNRLKVLTNPTQVKGGVKDPAGTVTVVVFNNTGVVGEYEATYKPLLSGKYWWSAQGIGVVDTKEERAFRVRPEKVIIP